MNLHDHNDEPPLSGDESFDPALDEFIRQAMGDRSAPGDGLRVARLERYWRSLRLRQSVKRWSAVAAGTAAAALVLVSLVKAPPLPEKLTVAQAEPPAPVVEQAQPEGTPPDISQSPAPMAEAPIVSRPPTDFERWMFAAQTRTPIINRTPTLAEELDAVLAGGAIDRLRVFDPTGVEQALIKRLEAGESATLGLFAEFGSAGAVPALLKRIESGESSAALAALESIVGFDAWPGLVRAANSPRQRELLVQWLLEDKSEPALVAFLRLVHDEPLRRETLAVAGAMPRLPIAELVGLLDNEDKTIRLAASLALGQLNRCEMTDALITRVSERPSHSKEAWFALFGCRCEAASSFLSWAAQRPEMLGQFNNARLQWARALP